MEKSEEIEIDKKIVYVADAVEIDSDDGSGRVLRIKLAVPIGDDDRIDGAEIRLGVVRRIEPHHFKIEAEVLLAADDADALAEHLRDYAAKLRSGWAEAEAKRAPRPPDGAHPPRARPAA
jgi:hypothetical protein